ncbi:hypothetical protein HF888_09135 [Bermanella marisrubri]|uniref:Uncharacterized protein n=1 Tax=Bermanella marisrubri TaxID=207949 RepID=Q1N6J7_9GAMM|nr:hypothetical protein [Bermanella marisrubri]EAT13595.1 hypothetical protein RED65_09394 [Oceanobacter sp. RED65] [Bermanella marisrubri]QIZ84383.1 hypothetical protein HF888_09135 [Bermanella marisrubri]
MTCRLCKRDCQLKNSHIIPEFLYRSLYDEKHRFYRISVEESEKSTFIQKGVREYLLCGDCEQRLSKYERYASTVLQGGVELTVSRDGNLIHIEGIDYVKFKLFSLSILWRSSISSLDIFKQVSLGPHEEKLRKMILAEDAGRDCEYPFIMSPITHEGALQKDLIIQPTKTKLEGHVVYRFTFGGIFWVFVVSGHRIPSVVVSASISTNGKLTMLPREITEMKYISNMATELARKGKV